MSGKHGNVGRSEHTLSPGHTHPAGFYLIAETPFILPERGGNAGFGPRRGELAGSIVDAVSTVARRADGVTGDGYRISIAITTRRKAVIPGKGSNWEET